MNEKSVTELGNPAKPQGEAGRMMLERMSESHKGLTSWAFSHIGLDGTENVLDIGCGGGAALKKISQKIRSGHLAGVDYSEVSVKLSTENNADDIRSGRMEIVRASAEKLPFEESSFDLVYTIESFYFWDNRPECLKEVRRVLAPDGVFMIIADIYGDASLSDEEKESVKKYNLFNPTREEFRKMLEKSGFSGVEIFTEEGTNRICVMAKKIS